MDKGSGGSSTAVPVCRKVFVALRDPAGTLPYFQHVEPGKDYDRGRVKVLFCEPRVCVVAGGTEIVYSDPYTVEERALRHNVLLVARRETRRRGVVTHKYVYPLELYRKFMKLYIEPLLRGEPPFSSGVVFAGAPGTGKSSMAVLVAKRLGLPSYKIAPTILSKWVGDSEKQLTDIITRARANAPSIVVLDDAEWIMLSRSLGGPAIPGETTHVALNLKNILFEALQEIKDTGEPVLFIATTNIKVSAIDQAFLRYGRFGESLVFPLPDYEAVYTVIKDIVGAAEAERIAKMIVNAGMGMADAIGFAHKYRLGVEKRPRPHHGRGYKRVVTERVEGFEKLFKYYPRETLEQLFSRPSRIYIHGLKEIGLAITAQLALHLNKPTMYLNEIEHFREAIHMANMINAVFVAPSVLEPLVLQQLHENLDTPLVIVGKTPPRPVLPYIQLFSPETLHRILGTKTMLQTLLAIYTTRIPQDVINDMEKHARYTEDLIQLMETLAATAGYMDKKLLSLLPRTPKM